MLHTMTNHKADIVIFGAGIAGLWTFNRLKRLGYDVLLLEKSGIGGEQSIASQGIIHSGLKYAFAGKINKLAQSISAMPDLWRAALRGEGDVDLSAARTTTTSQLLMIPSGFMGGLTKLVAQKALGGEVREVDPTFLNATGFKGSVVYMDEPVLDTPSLFQALAEPYKDCIRKVDHCAFEQDADGAIAGIKIDGHRITADHYIFTAAGSNHEIATQLGHDKGLETQKRPLLMGMMKPAPFPLWAHLVGKSDKPISTITTHEMPDGELVWYIGGGPAERAKEADPQEVIDTAKAGFAKYMPNLNLDHVQWATLPIDRVEGKSNTDGWMPDTPTIHTARNALYCWPTKLTFAPMLAESLLKKVGKPSGQNTNWSFLPEAPYANAPWEDTTWTD